MSVFRQELIMEAPHVKFLDKLFNHAVSKIEGGQAMGEEKNRLWWSKVSEKRMRELYNKRREKLENQQAAGKNLPKNLAEVEGGWDPPAVNESADLTTTSTADVPVPPKHDATPEASLPATPEPTVEPPITSSISAPSSLPSTVSTTLI